jgi:hypothetical protein
VQAGFDNDVQTVFDDEYMRVKTAMCRQRCADSDVQTGFDSEDRRVKRPKPY